MKAFEHFKAEMFCPVHPYDDIVRERGINHPTKNVTGALVKNKNTGLYSIICQGVRHSVPQDWAKQYDETFNLKIDGTNDKKLSEEHTKADSSVFSMVSDVVNKNSCTDFSDNADIENDIDR